MISKLFCNPKVIKKYKDGPVAPYVDDFAQLLLDRRYPVHGVQVRIAVIADLNRWLKDKNIALKQLNQSRINEYLIYRKQRIGIAHFKTSKFVLKLFADHLRSRNIIPSIESKILVTEVSQHLATYQEYLIQEKALSNSTIQTYSECTRQFLNELFGKWPIKYKTINPKDIYRYTLRHSNDFSPGRVKLMVTSLRSYLQFIFLQKKTEIDLSLSVPTIPDRRSISIPRFLENNQVQLILKSCDRKTKVGKRDYAVLLLLSRLALRACEVWRLTLEDLDWEKGEISVRGKGSRLNRFPLPRDVGAALVDYLKHGRPKTTSRNLFLISYSPFSPITNSATISTIVWSAITRAGLNPPTKGAHLLRHSAATQVLRQGGSLREVGELLRHRQINTSAIYAKVDLSRLAQLAQPWPFAQAMKGAL